MQSEIDRAHWVGEIASALKMREENIWQELERIKGKSSPKKSDDEGVIPQVRGRRGLIEERLIGLAVWKKNDLAPVLSECKAEWFSPERRQIFESSLTSGDEDHYLKKLALEAEVVYGDAENLVPELKSLIRELKKEGFKDKLVNLGESIRELEKSGSKEELEKKFVEFKSISAELNSI